MTKAIALLSGGLDSILATKLMLEQGIEVEALNFLTVFCNCTAHGKTCLASKSAADTLGVPLKVFEITKEYLEIVKNPKHGYGSNMNPCLDCRIFIFRKAGEYMKQTGASFIFTGEVLGERPMSQRKDAMRTIENESGLKGFIVRPLSSKLMEPSIPEKEGLVDREKFLSISGRSRKPQIQLAKDFGINDYPCPAGGCLLTDPGFARRMRDLLKHKPDITINDVQLLKVGRHFRLNTKAKLIVGRNDEENKKLSSLSKENDFHFYPLDTTGPTGIGRGAFDEDSILKAGRIVARYSDGEPNQPLKITCKEKSTGHPEVLPMGEEELNALRV
ncbi:MAG: hypothetical protein HQ549_00440 [Candidatus Omnitrophica bacterium]|nr:hypothetical protein [Candidatus Omnitrophota bacterium]